MTNSKKTTAYGRLVTPYVLINCIQLVLAVVIIGCISRGVCYRQCTGTDFETVRAKGQRFVLVVVSFAAICTLVTGTCYLLDWDEKKLRGDITLKTLKCWVLVFLPLFLFLVAAMECSYASGYHLRYSDYDHGAWIAAALFLFLNASLYAIECVWLWRETGLAKKNELCLVFRKSYRNRHDSQQETPQVSTITYSHTSSSNQRLPLQLPVETAV